MANSISRIFVLSAGAARRLLEDAGPAIAARLGVELTLDFAPVGVVLEWLREGLAQPAFATGQKGWFIV